MASIYKSYKNVPKADNIFIYEDVKLFTYNEYMDNILFNWLDEIHYIFFEKHIGKSLDIDSVTEIMLYSSIIRCTREILYNQIRTQYNWIQKDRLQGMLLAAYFLACKIILEIDFIHYLPSLKSMCWMTRETYTPNEITDMEIKLFENSNYSSSLKVYKRLYKLK